MKTICAWCKKELDQDDSFETIDMVSHGICVECLNYFFPKKGPRSFDEFLDLLAVPVIVIDENFKVTAASNSARRLLEEKVGNLRGVRPGMALECPYARLPEGCGQTVHCKSCAVRLTVLDTFKTGRSHYDVPAYRDICVGQEGFTIHCHISTEKFGEFVFLRIQEVGDDGK